MVELKIDKEFKEKIPPLTDAEFEQLRENILADGEVYEPIVTWDGVIVDGHNRWRVIQENPQIPFRTKEMDFADKWAAFEWMYRKQLGRRNLSDEQKTYLLGKLYEARKNCYGGDRKSSRQNGDMKPNGRTVQIIAKEQGVGSKTVERAEHFAKGLDAIREVSPAAADKVLDGKAGVSKQTIAEMRNADGEEVKEVAKAIEEGKPVSRKPRPMSPQMKDFTEKIVSVVEEMEDLTKERKYGLDDAMRDLNSAEDIFINQVEFVLEERKEVISSDERGKEQVIGFIESVINDLNNLKGRFI